MWKLESETNSTRVYRNSTTNSECKQTMCYTDHDGNLWWEFIDLISIPFTRSFAATKITSLYSLGLTMEDVNAFLGKHKATLKSADGEKYERAYAELLDFESKIKAAADPIRQMTSLVCVYFTMNDEPIDSFMNEMQLKKMSLLEVNPYMHSFFLSRQIELLERYKNSLSPVSPTVSTRQKN